MSILYHSFRIGELYEALGSGDQSLMNRLRARLMHRDPELWTVAKAIVVDGLLYHETFPEELYNTAIIQVVQALPSYQNFSDNKDYQIDYHDALLRLPRKSLLHTYWGYLTHGRYLFDHPIHPLSRARYGYLKNEEIPEFLHLVEQECELLPWYFFQQSIDAVQKSLEIGDDLFVSIFIKGRRYKMIRVRDSREP